MWWEGWEWEELRDGRNRSWPSAGSKEEAGGETDLSLREEAVVIVIVVMVETGLPNGCTCACRELTSAVFSDGVHNYAEVSTMGQVG